MSSQADIEDLKTVHRSSIPTSPFEIQITKEALQRRLDAGDITKDDIEVLRRSYRWMTISCAVGWASGIPAYIALRRWEPQAPRLKAIMGGMTVAIIGSFMGFAAGGAAGAIEVRNHMPDADRKLKVFQQIVIDSKRAIEEHRRGIPTGTLIEHRAGVPEENKYIRPEGDAPTSAPTPSSAPDSISGKINAETGSTWERLRTTRPSPPPALTPEDDLKRQQAEFDAMLDKERRGGDDLDKWR